MTSSEKQSNARINPPGGTAASDKFTIRATPVPVGCMPLLCLARAGSFGADCSASRPVRITCLLEIHLEKSSRLLAGHNPISDLPPRTILDDRRVAYRHCPCRYLPDITIGRRREHEVTDLTLCIGMQC